MQTCSTQKLGNIFLAPGLGKEGEQNACCFAQEKFEKADQ